MNSGFFKHLFLWLFIIPLLAVFTLPIFYGIEHYTISIDEMDMHEKLIGKEPHDKAIASAIATYKKFIQPASHWMCSTQINNSQNVDTKSIDWIFKQSNKSRCQALMRGFYRFDVEMSFMLGVFILAIAAFYDGVMQRAIGKYQFGYNNPLAFHLVTHSLIAILGLTFIGVFLPIAFSFSYYLAYCVLVTGASWMISKNFQTGT